MPHLKALAPAAALLIAGCLAPPPGPVPPGDTVPTASAPPATPSPAATASPTPAPTAAPSVQTVMVSGRLFDDGGAVIPEGEVEVQSADAPQLNGTLKALGGAFVLPGVPVGASVTLTARAPGFGARRRVVQAKVQPANKDEDVNRTDFGGEEAGAYYALSEYPDIESVTPGNLQKGVKTQPLEITLKFSHPIRESERSRVARLLQIRFPTPGTVDTILVVGTEYEGKVATLEWNAEGTVATFRFDAPIVSRRGDASAVTIGFDDQDIDAWPQATNGMRLGRERSNETVDAVGGTVRNRVAAFMRDDAPAVKPSERPTASEIWGKGHRTTSRFSLSAEAGAPKVLSATAARSSTDERIYVKFDRPVRGYPETSLDGSATRPSNYRVVFGRTERADDREEFEGKDPATAGGPPESIGFHSQDPNQVVLRFATGTFSDNRAFKLYVEANVKDVAGMPLEAGVTLQGTL